jgi:hypothetical protein
MLGVVVQSSASAERARPLANGGPCLMRSFAASQSETRLGDLDAIGGRLEDVVCDTNASPVLQCS